MNYLLKRISQAIITVFAVMTLSFVLIRYMPGGPMDYLRATLEEQGMGEEEINSIVEAYTNVNPDEPIHIEYINYMSSFFMGDLGYSIWYDQSVSEVLAAALPWTLFVMTTALVTAFTIGISFGAMMGYKEASRFDYVMTGVTTFMSSVPFYVIALFLLTALGYRAGYFPLGGRYPTGVSPAITLEFFSGAIYHAILPIFSILLAVFGGIALAMRGNSIQVLGEDYLRVARLRGLSDRKIALSYVSRNAILPLYTGFMISIGSAFGGSVILEEIFRYPGVGWYLLQALQARDYILMMGAFTLITVAVVIALFFADMTYGMIDPTAKTGDDRESY